MRVDARLAAAVTLVCCVLTVGADAQPAASQQSGGGEQRQDAQEPQPQARDADPAQQAPAPADNRQSEHRGRAENNPQDGGGEAGLFAWAKGWWIGFIGFVEANDKFLVALGTLVTAAFTAILGGATVALWRATRDLVEGTERSLALAQRPWIQVEPAIAGPLRVNGAELSLTLKLTMLNVGQTPAPSVEHHIKAVPRTQKTFHADVQQLRLAERIKKRRRQDRSGNLIFAKTGIEREITLGPTPDEVRAALAEHDPAFPKLMLYVIGSVSYRFPFNDELHQTGFIYDVMVMDDTNPFPSRYIDAASGEIPAARLVLNAPMDESPYID